MFTPKCLLNIQRFFAGYVSKALVIIEMLESVEAKYTTKEERKLKSKVIELMKVYMCVLYIDIC